MSKIKQFEPLTNFIKNLISKGFSNKEIETILESLEDLTALYNEVKPIPKTIDLLRRQFKPYLITESK